MAGEPRVLANRRDAGKSTGLRTVDHAKQSQSPEDKAKMASPRGRACRAKQSQFAGGPNER